MPEQRHLPVGVYKKTISMFMYIWIHRPRLWKRWHLRNRNEFLILSQWSISSEGSRFRISRTYDTYWIWPIVGEKKDGSTSPIFMLFFSTLVKRLVYDEQQRIQATFLKFWMPLSLFQRLSLLFEVAQTHPRPGIQCRKKWAKIFPLGSPSFYCSLASSLANADK